VPAEPLPVPDPRIPTTAHEIVAWWIAEVGRKYPTLYAADRDVIVVTSIAYIPGLMEDNVPQGPWRGLP
jgi:hypothetical protein